MGQERAKQQREEFLDRMLTEVHKIPVADVVGSVVDLVPKGRHLLGLCPFHADQNLGSFVVTPDMNIWTCFAEGIGGSPVKFVMEYYDLKYLPAAFRLAVDYGIITPEEYKKYSGKRWNENTVKRIQQRLEEPTKVKAYKANEYIIAAVYNAIAKVCPLSEAHKKHLKRERKLSDAELADYFTFPTRRMDLAGKVFKEIAESLARKKYDKNLQELDGDQLITLDKQMQRVSSQMKYVPGFFFNKNTNRVDFASYKGIGILARDDRGMAVGIQIRRDVVKPGEQRYVWFSSAFAQSQGYTEGGASSGSPGGFIKSKTETNAHHHVCITEGRFKAEKIAANGSDAIYVSGVSTWKSIIPVVKRVCKQGERVYLMFDADMLGNTAVKAQLSAMKDELEKLHLSPWLVLWRKSNGKGFDDLVIGKGEGYKKLLTYMKYEDFVPVYDKTLKQVLATFGVSSVRDLPQENREAFSTEMQEEMETNLDLK